MNLTFLAAAMISLAVPGDSGTVDSGDAQLMQLGFARTSGDTQLLDFRADWCGPCRQMDPIVGSLLAEGYPVRRVNVDQERELANHFGVQGIPCFVMVVNGKEVDRAVGVTDRGRLEAMFSRNGVQPGMNAVRGQSPGIGLLSGNAIPFPPTQQSAGGAGNFFSGRFNSQPSSPPDTFAHGQDFPGPDQSSPRYDHQPNNHRNWGSEEQAGANAQANYDAMLRASVRLRIEDENGISRGSGTIIDTRSGEGLIITCGHMFREAAKDGKIWVDLFGPGAPQGVPGKLIDYDLKSEVGLIRISTSYPLTAARLAPPGYSVCFGDKVISMGCDGGADATPRDTQVTSINRYVGAPNLQVAFQPVQGRSGGGLFTSEGWVVGVCYAADPEANEGLFTALPALCDELDHVGLSFVYHEPSAGAQSANIGRQQLPPHGIETAQTDRNVTPAEFADQTGTTFPQSTGLSPTHPQLLTDRGAQQLSANDRAALEAICHETQGAELVCIVHSQGNPQAESEIIVMDHVSPALLEQLTAQQQTTQRR